GRDAEEMARRVEVAYVIDVRRDFGRRELVVVAQEAHQILACELRLLTGDVHLGSVAGRDDDGLVRGAALRQRAERPQQAARLEIDTLAHVDRRGAMTDSDEQQMHSASP